MAVISNKERLSKKDVYYIAVPLIDIYFQFFSYNRLVREWMEHHIEDSGIDMFMNRVHSDFLENNVYKDLTIDVLKDAAINREWIETTKNIIGKPNELVSHLNKIMMQNETVEIDKEYQFGGIYYEKEDKSKEEEMEL